MRANILVAVAIAVLPASLRADHGTAPARPRELAAEGRAAHDRRDYEHAIAAFQEAYALAPSPALLFNLAQSYRLQGSCEEAATMYRRYLASRADLEARALAETHLATVERCARKRSLNIPVDDAEDHRRGPISPSDPGAIAPAPPTELATRVPARPRELGVTVAPRRSPPAPAHLLKTVGLGSILGATAALGIAAYYGLRAHDAAEDVERAYAVGGTGKDVAERDADGRRAVTKARIFGIGGGVALVTGITLVIAGKRVEHAAPIAITPSSTAPEVSYTWRF